jgi:Tfp pilus assembly protein PilZ
LSSDFRKSRDLIDQVIEEAKAIEDLSSEGYQWPVDSESPPEKDFKEREHGRADLSGKSIELHFQSGEHFAKSYIENISVGGLFVRSEEPRRLGELIDVSFSLPGGFAQAPLHLSVRAKVARVTPHGCGLEFVSLDASTRHELETYVRGVLPTGVDLKANIKGSTAERLRELRKEKHSRNSYRNRFVLKISVLFSLILINGVLLFAPRFVDLRDQKWSHTNQSFFVGNQKISIPEVRALRSERSGSFSFELTSGSEVRVDKAQALPAVLRVGFEKMNSLHPQKIPRLPINSKASVKMKLKKDGARKRR